MTKQTIDLTDKRVGHWTVLKKDPEIKRSDKRWLCRCECGKEKSVRECHLIAKTRGSYSCGCYGKQQMIKAKTKHGLLADGARPSEYSTWVNIKQRCYNPTGSGYKYYGERGIQVCERWMNDFASFYQDLGPKPSPRHTIERINNNGDYEPTNCCWATPLQQRHNRRDT